MNEKIFFFFLFFLLFFSLFYFIVFLLVLQREKRQHMLNLKEIEKWEEILKGGGKWSLHWETKDKPEPRPRKETGPKRVSFKPNWIVFLRCGWTIVSQVALDRKGQYLSIKSDDPIPNLSQVFSQWFLSAGPNPNVLLMHVGHPVVIPFRVDSTAKCQLELDKSIIFHDVSPSPQETVVSPSVKPINVEVPMISSEDYLSIASNLGQFSCDMDELCVDKNIDAIRQDKKTKQQNSDRQRRFFYPGLWSHGESVMKRIGNILKVKDVGSVSLYEVHETGNMFLFIQKLSSRAEKAKTPDVSFSIVTSRTQDDVAWDDLITIDGKLHLEGKPVETTQLDEAREVDLYEWIHILLGPLNRDFKKAVSVEILFEGLGVDLKRSLDPRKCIKRSELARVIGFPENQLLVCSLQDWESLIPISNSPSVTAITSLGPLSTMTILEQLLFVKLDVLSKKLDFSISPEDIRWLLFLASLIQIEHQHLKRMKSRNRLKIWYKQKHRFGSTSILLSSHVKQMLMLLMDCQVFRVCQWEWNKRAFHIFVEKPGQSANPIHLQAVMEALCKIQLWWSGLGQSQLEQNITDFIAHEMSPLIDGTRNRFCNLMFTDYGDEDLFPMFADGIESKRKYNALKTTGRGGGGRNTAIQGPSLSHLMHALSQHGQHAQMLFKRIVDEIHSIAILTDLKTDTNVLAFETKQYDHYMSQTSPLQNVRRRLPDIGPCIKVVILAPDPDNHTNRLILSFLDEEKEALALRSELSDMSTMSINPLNIVTARLSKYLTTIQKKRKRLPANQAALLALGAELEKTLAHDLREKQKKKDEKRKHEITRHESILKVPRQQRKLQQNKLQVQDEKRKHEITSRQESILKVPKQQRKLQVQSQRVKIKPRPKAAHLPASSKKVVYLHRHKPEPQLEDDEGQGQTWSESILSQIEKEAEKYVSKQWEQSSKDLKIEVNAVVKELVDQHSMNKETSKLYLDIYDGLTTWAFRNLGKIQSQNVESTREQIEKQIKMLVVDSFKKR